MNTKDCSCSRGGSAAFCECRADYTVLKDHELEALIVGLQRLQKTSPPTSSVWADASEQLKPLFAEMARRTGGAK